MNIKKLDEKEVVFVDQRWTDEERKLLSELLKRKKDNKTSVKRRFASKTAAVPAGR